MKNEYSQAAGLRALSFSEKKGGTKTLSEDSIAIQTFVDNMKLVDTDMSNGLFTWNIRQEESLK